MPFCRFRFVKKSTCNNLGNFNATVRQSNDKEYMILSLHGKDEGSNQGEEYHASFFPEQMKNLYFRMRYEMECKTRPEVLNAEFKVFTTNMDDFRNRRNQDINSNNKAA